MATLILNKALTQEVSSTIGEEIIVADFIESHQRNGKGNQRNLIFIVNDKYKVTVQLNVFNGTSYETCWNAEKLSKEEIENRMFGRRISEISKEGEVPWNIGIMVAHIEDKETAVNLLKHINNCRPMAHNNFKNELHGDLRQMVSAIKKVIGEENWRKLRCNNEEQLAIFAHYLAGR